MAGPSPTVRLLERARAAGFAAPLAAFLDGSTSHAARLAAMQSALRGPMGSLVRRELGKWIAETLGVLIPATSANWRALVEDAMQFVVERLPEERLAPKLVEQLELPSNTPPEKRLLLLIAKVPGLQKLGQVLARNRALEPRLRNALAKLENGIRDMKADAVRAIVAAQLQQRLVPNQVRLAARLRSEATVSAVLPFTWKITQRMRRERGVFKVLKPHIPAYFAEDMRLLQGLAEYLKRNHRRYGVGARGLADMFREVRLLLKHEVEFAGEQRRLRQAAFTYGALNGIRVPRVIPQLCTPIVTAMTDERGAKITQAVRKLSASQRRRVAERAIDAVIATPLFAGPGDAMFHADPHAGNLMYDKTTGEVVLLDWALAGTLTPEQRRRLITLFLMVLLRDSTGIFDSVQGLSLRPAPRNSRTAREIRRTIDEFLAAIPVSRMPDSMDAMRLLQRLAFETVRLPGSLMLLRKVMFTLEAIVYDIVGGDVAVDKILVRSLFWKWLTRRLSLGSPLNTGDWMRVQASLLLSGSRWCLQAAQALVNAGGAGAGNAA